MGLCCRASESELRDPGLITHLLHHVVSSLSKTHKLPSILAIFAKNVGLSDKTSKISLCPADKCSAKFTRLQC